MGQLCWPVLCVGLASLNFLVLFCFVFAIKRPQIQHRLIQKGLNQPRKGKNNDQAHPPIHPTNLAQRNELTADEQKVYELVTRHYLACLSYDGKGKQTVVTLELAEEVFSASGLIIEERNYLEVYPYDVWSAHTMPAFQQGERYFCISACF